MALSLSDHLPVGVSSVKSNMEMATVVMRTNGTMKDTRHATCGVRPRLCTLSHGVSMRTRNTTLGCLQRIIDGRHHEVCDTTTRVAPTTDQCICCADDISVEEASGPHLTRHKSATQDAHKETDSIEASCIFRSASQSCRDRTEKQAAHEGVPRPEPITQRSSNSAHDERRRQRYDVRISYFILRQVHILLDGDAQLLGVSTLQAPSTKGV